ncbi:MAG: hypothetical protein ACPGLV_10405 [Bacteroidia bacterium]
MNGLTQIKLTKHFNLHIVLLIITTVLTSCSSDSDTLWFEQGQMLSLKLTSKDFKYNIEGNEVNEIGYFYSKRKIEGFNKMLISGVKSTWDNAPIKFKMKVLYRGQEQLVTKELIKEGIYSSESTEGLFQIYFEFIDENGIFWSTYPNPASKNKPKSHIEIISFEPRYSPLNGSRKEKVSLSFESTFYNEANQKLDITGVMHTVVEPKF